MDDAEIIERVQTGDSEFFSLLVDKYHKPLLNFIYRMVGDRQIVEDIGQDIFLNIYKSIRTFDTSRAVPFSAWLFIAARNRCICELRRKKPSTRSIEETGEWPAATKTPEQIASDEERLQAIHEALEQLPEPFKSTILQSLGGIPPEKIALKHRISTGTVKSRLFRARAKMRLLLCEHFGGSRYGQF